MTREEYGEAYKKGFDGTVRFLKAHRANFDTAREVAQIAWTRGWEKIDQLRDPRRVAEWVNKIAIREYISLLRRKRPVQLSEIEREPALSAAGLAPATIDVRRAMGDCKPRPRQLLEARYWMGWSTRELAKGMGTSEDAVRNALSRARIGLRQRLTGTAA